MNVGSCGQCMESWATNDVNGAEQVVDEVFIHAHKENHNLDVVTDEVASALSDLSPVPTECACGRVFPLWEAYSTHVRSVHGFPD